MCNPRRVEITATRQVAEAWEREVQRVAERSALVTGEARVQQPLDASVALPALDALEQALEAGMDGWHPVDHGFCCEVDGGAVIYRPEERILEIVARMSDQVQGQGTARVRLEGRVQAEFHQRASAFYYDDGYGGRTEDVAAREARQEAERGLDQLVAERLQGAASAAVVAAAPALDARADEAARADLDRRAASRRRELEAQAAERLHAVGVRARHAFHRVLAVAYRDALLALARARGAQQLRCDDAGDVLEIEFLLPD
jgi:hypothetical protein